MRTSIVTLILLLSNIGIWARPLDSLWTMWNDQSQADTTRLDAINKLAWDGYLFSQPDSAFYFAGLQFDFAKENGRKEHMASALRTQGITYILRGNEAKAIDYYTRCLTIYKEVATSTDTKVAKSGKKGIAAVMNNLAMVYKDQGKFERAIEHYTQSLAMYHDIEDKLGIAGILNNTGIIYLDRGDHATAVDRFTESLKMYESVIDSSSEASSNAAKRGIANPLNNIGIIYEAQIEYERAIKYYARSLAYRKEIGDTRGIATSLNNIGNIYQRMGKHSKTDSYYTQSLALREEIGDKSGMANSLNNLGNNLEQQGDSAHNAGDIVLAEVKYTLSVDYHIRSLALREEIGYKQGIAGSLNNIGRIYRRRDDYANAIDYCSRGLALAQEIGAAADIMKGSWALFDVYKLSGQYQESLEMYELYIVTKDSIDSEENKKEVVRQEMKYEYEKAELVKTQEEKEKARIEAATASRRDNLQYSIILIAILSLFGGVLALGFINVSPRMAEGIIFFAFLIFFEFLLVLADPYIEGWSRGAPGIKLLFNAGIAALIFPLHAAIESNAKSKLLR